MTRYAYFVDLTICAGCESCTVACQNKNGLEPDTVYTKVHRYETGTFPNLTGTFVTSQCMHCAEPPCALVCPTGATYKTAEGPVQVDGTKCIGCQYCVTACQYGARVMNEDRVAEKCSFCLDRLQAGKLPACAQTCLTGARQVGDLDDPKSALHGLIKQPGTVQIAGTSFYYRLPESIARDVAPPDSKVAGVTYAWQSIFQPVGQLMLGGVAGALLVSVASNLIQSARHKGEGEPHGDH